MCVNLKEFYSEIKKSLHDYHWILLGLSMTLAIIAVNRTETQMSLPQNRIIVNKCRWNIWQQVIRKSWSDCGRNDAVQNLNQHSTRFLLRN